MNGLTGCGHPRRANGLPNARCFKPKCREVEIPDTLALVTLACGHERWLDGSRPQCLKPKCRPHDPEDAGDTRKEASKEAGETSESKGVKTAATVMLYDPDVPVPDIVMVPTDRDLLDALLEARRPPLHVPLVDAEGLSVLAGTTGAGKSLLALDVAAAVARGAKTWGSWVQPEPRPRSVLLIDAENGVDVLAERRRALREDAPSLRVAALEEFPSGSGVLQAIMDRVAVDHVDLCIIDNLSLFNTATDRNDETQMQAMLTGLVQLTRLIDAPILVVSHMSKFGERDVLGALRSGKLPDGMDAIMGSGLTFKIARWVAVVAHDRSRGEHYLGLLKARSASLSSKVWRFMLDEADPIPTAPHANLVRIGEWIEHEPKTRTKEPVIAAAIDRLFEEGETEITIDQIIKTSGAARNTVKKYISDEDYAPAFLERHGLDSKYGPSSDKGGRPPLLIFREG